MKVRVTLYSSYGCDEHTYRLYSPDGKLFDAGLEEEKHSNLIDGRKIHQIEGKNILEALEMLRDSGASVEIWPC